MKLNPFKRSAAQAQPGNDPDQPPTPHVSAVPAVPTATAAPQSNLQGTTTPLHDMFTDNPPGTLPLAGTVTPIAPLTDAVPPSLPSISNPISEHGAGQANDQPDKLTLNNAIHGPAPAWQEANLNDSLPTDKVGSQLESHDMGLMTRDSRDGSSEIVQMSDGTYQSVNKTNGKVSSAGTWGDGHGGGIALNGVGNTPDTAPLAGAVTSISDAIKTPSPGSVTPIASPNIAVSTDNTPTVSSSQVAAKPVPAWHANQDWTAADDATRAGIAQLASGIDTSKVLETRAGNSNNYLLRMSDGTYKSVDLSSGNVSGAGTWNASQWNSSQYVTPGNNIPAPASPASPPAGSVTPINVSTPSAPPVTQGAVYVPPVAPRATDVTVTAPAAALDPSGNVHHVGRAGMTDFN